MPYERDRFLFHYTTREAAFAHILPSGELRFSRYMDMRDPLENKHWRILAGGWGRPTEEEERRQMLGYFQFDNIAAQIREQSFLLSMTEDAPPDRDEAHPFFHGWARARMWEQYAEKHFGVCLVFDRAKLTEAVVSSLQNQGFAPPYHRSVIYEGHGMHKPMPDLNSLADGVTPAHVTAYIEENHELLFFHKVRDWETEHEYRFSTTSSDKDQLFIDYAESLVGVIVGEKFPDWERPAAIAACRKAGATPERLDWTMGAPVLAELKPLENRRDEIRENIEVPPQPTRSPADNPGSP
jgi:hypothetical protein